MKRFLQRNIETKLARALISAEIAEDGKVTFSVEKDELVMAGKAEAARAGEAR